MPNANTKSLHKVYEYIQEKKQASPSQINTDLKMNFNTTKSCISSLQKLNKVEQISNGKVSIIQLKE